MVKVKKNLINIRFGRLIVRKQVEDYVRPNGKRESKWLCECDCGKFVEVTGCHLKSGHTKSCGCLVKEIIVKNGLNSNNLIPNTKRYNIYDLTGEYGIGYTSKGEEFYFDLEDYELIKDHCWHIDANGYVVCSEKILLHVLIMNPINGELIDHIKHKKYDNRKSELRYVDYTQSSINRGVQSNNTSGVTGVGFHKKSKKWFAYIMINKRQIRKYAKTKNDAIILRKELEEKYFGEYSYYNSMKGGSHEYVCAV